MDGRSRSRSTTELYPAMNTLTAPSPISTDYAAFSPAKPVIEVKSRPRRLPWGKFLSAGLFVAFAAWGIGGYLNYSAGFETTDDSFLEGNVHPVSPRINGTVTRVLVDDNAHVEAGQPLFEIDAADLNLAAQGSEADLAQARANETQVSAQIARAQADVEAATARIAQNAAQLHRAELDFNRVETLASDEVRALSKQDLDAARATFETAQAARQSLLAERTSAEAALAASRAQRGVAQAQIQKAEAALDTAKLQVGYTTVRAPSAGRIAKKTVEVGQRLQTGQPVMSVVSDQVWVIANFKESQLAHLRAGEKVEVRIDAIDGHVFQGVVESFSPGTGAKFSLLPPDNATGNFTKVVQRVPVKILFAPDSLGTAASRLAPGLSAFVKISTRD
jgi:membrane fusion protein, multidrug efflux system